MTMAVKPARAPLEEAPPGFPMPSAVSRPAPPRPLPTGLDALVHRAIGAVRGLSLRSRALQSEAADCHAAMQALHDLSDTELKGRLAIYRAEFRRDAVRGRGNLISALAAIGEAAGRSLGLRPHPVQFMGALALHRGFLAEMATGEGKTLTASLAATLAAWSGRPCHLVTANDYLAARDAEQMEPLYACCDVSVAAVTGDLPPHARSVRYGADVVYVTAKELLADHLRDRQAGADVANGIQAMLTHWLPRREGGRSVLMRGLHTAIVDEADSVLIDEAVTPLILSASRSDEDLRNAVQVATEVAKRLVAGVDYRMDTRHKHIALAASGRVGIAEVADRLPPLWRSASRREELLRQALVAKCLLRRDHDYVVHEGKVVLLDEATGRMMPHRTLSAGLHQAVEAHEDVAVSDPTETIGQMSFQKFFRHFRRLAGTSGTAKEAAGELWRIYALTVVRIPTNRPCRRVHAAPIICASLHEKWEAVLTEIDRTQADGRPILVGTRSVQASELLADLLRKRGIEFELLNATRHHNEAGIIARAGELGRVTIATNMAGRGTDIQLPPPVRERGGLHVIATEMHESPRVDRQLVGRCGRQGDPGSVRVFISADDDLLRRCLPEAVRKLVATALVRGVPGANGLARAAFRLAQFRGERQAHGRRRAVLETDRWLDMSLPFSRES